MSVALLLGRESVSDTTQIRCARTHWRRTRSLALAVSTALTAGLISISVLPRMAAADDGSADPSPLTAASMQAQSSGQPVVVDDETTETSQVTAEPDGSFTLASSLTPVRVQQDGQWRDIDTTLQANPDGSVSPAATAEDVTFSGGGSDPAVTVSEGDSSIAFDWPTSLPIPTLDGDTATYPSVLPGVDLALTARADSFSEVLVVHDAAAATDPQLTHLHLDVDTTGLSVARDSAGGIAATDPSGTAVLAGSQPVMWDSYQAPDSAPPSASDPETGRISPIPMSVPAATVDSPDDSASTTLTLNPPAAALTGSDVQYPVFIDPTLNPPRSDFAVVTTDNNWHYYDDSSNDLKVGYCNWSECDGAWKARTYLSFDVSDLGGQATTAKVYSAEIDAYEIHNAGGCTSEPVDLYTAGSIDSSTAWPGPLGTKLDESSSNLSDSCNGTAGDVAFTSSSLKSQFQTAATNDTNTLTFALKAPDESDRNQWKRFDNARTGTAAAQIIVHYDFPPSTPSHLHLDNTVDCPGQPLYTRDTWPNLHAQATDYNSPHVPIAMWYEIDDANGRVRYNPHGIVADTDTDAPWTTTSTNSNSNNPLSEGTYKFDAYATSRTTDTQDAAGGTSGWVSFTIDDTAPPVPTVTSHDFPEKAWGAVGSGHFTFHGSADTAGFAYSFDSSGSETLPTDTTCSYSTPPTTAGGMVPASDGSAIITTPTLTAGYHQLYIKAFDNAHNVSAQTSVYVFYVAQTYANEGSTKQEAENLNPPSQPVGQSDQVYLHDNDAYSGGTAAQLVANGPASFTFQINAPLDADYAVGVELGTYNHYGEVSFAVDGNPVEINGAALPPQDTNSPTLGTMYVPLGGYHWTTTDVDGNPVSTTHTITINIVGTTGSSFTYDGSFGYSSNGYHPANFSNYADNGYTAVVDDIRAVPINNVTFTKFADAVNNDGVAVENSTAGDIGPSTGHLGFGYNSLIAKEFIPGDYVTVDSDTTVVVDGVPTSDAATFYVNSYSGADNVIATGQTINLDSPADANWVDLLVTSTCGSTAWSAANQLTIHFADGTSTDVRLPVIPNWYTATVPAPQSGQRAFVTNVLTLPYSTRGTTTDSSHQPSLFHVAFPTGFTGSAVQSVTLPNLGSDLTESCSTANLHVFSMTTH